MVTSAVGKVMKAREVQPFSFHHGGESRREGNVGQCRASNVARMPMWVTESGTTNSVSEVHPKKAAFPMEVSEAGRMS